MDLKAGALDLEVGVLPTPIPAKESVKVFRRWSNTKKETKPLRTFLGLGA